MNNDKSIIELNEKIIFLEKELKKTQQYSSYISENMNNVINYSETIASALNTVYDLLDKYNIAKLVRLKKIEEIFNNNEQNNFII